DVSKIDLQPYVWDISKETDFPDEGSDKTTIAVCHEAQREIRRNENLTVRESSQAVMGHKLQSQLKIAAILALIEGRTEVQAEDWEIARELIRYSDEVQEQMRAIYQRAAAKKNRD